MLPKHLDGLACAALAALAIWTTAFTVSRRRVRPFAGTVVPMEGDGNCLFRALAHPERDHAQVRASVARHLSDHWATYSCFVCEKERDGYLRAMATPGVWGDELALSAYSDLYEEAVEVYQGAPSAPQLMRRYGRGAAPRRVFFSGGVHYDALELDGSAV